MIVVADTGALISLATINKLSLLDKLYGEIYIPQAVWKELLHHSDKFGENNFDSCRSGAYPLTLRPACVQALRRGC